MQLANGQWEIMVNGITVATCDNDASKNFLCASLGFAFQSEGVTNWTRAHIAESFNAVIVEDNAANRCDCGDPDCDRNCEFRDEDRLPGEDMDGDAASALASAGFGTDEDYEHDTPLGDAYGGE